MVFNISSLLGKYLLRPNESGMPVVFRLTSYILILWQPSYSTNSYIFKSQLFPLSCGFLSISFGVEKIRWQHQLIGSSLLLPRSA